MADDDLKLTYRVWSPYSERVVERASAARLKVNQFARVATIQAVDSDFVAVNDRLARLEEMLEELIQDFRRATE